MCCVGTAQRAQGITGVQGWSQWASHSDTSTQLQQGDKWGLTTPSQQRIAAPTPSPSRYCPLTAPHLPPGPAPWQPAPLPPDPHRPHAPPWTLQGAPPALTWGGGWGEGRAGRGREQYEQAHRKQGRCGWKTKDGELQAIGAGSQCRPRGEEAAQQR